ncbi:uncharacterized protein [Antedon mediterranea]|uniref:uncharacterized protein n=1 Tax=Antedon mediterranea TaxID=105859 RepID=UPI003AF661C3
MNYWQPFKKRGVVTGWRFIAQRSRAVDVLILRPTADILTFQIIARKTVTFTSEDVGNEVEHVLQYSEQVYYLPGDMYGIWNGDGNDYVLLQTHTMFLNNVMYLRTETNEVLGSEDTHVTFTQRVQRYISFEPVVLGDHDPQLVFKLHVEQDYKLQSNSIETITNLNRIACISRCIQNELCKSINYNNGQMSCDLNNIAKDSDPSNYVSEIGQTYLEMEPKTMRSFSKCNVVDCGIGKMCEPSDNKEGYICRCISTGYVSDYCPVEECTGALGMQSGGILNDQISASSLYNCAACYAYCGRLHKNEGDVNSASACVSAWVTYPGANEWLKVDLLVEHNITGVVTQGRDITYDDQWVTHYTISYFEVDQVGETYITDGNGKIKVFDGNFHRDDPRAHYFSQTVRATAIKFHAREWKNYISMRVEILGCRFGHQWARVFKGISRNGLSIYDAWVSGTGASSYHAHRFLISNTHYRNVAIMNNWSSLSITKVRLTLYSEFNKELLSILFNGVGTTKDTWFARENVEYSPWSDLTTQSVNYFSIDGQSSNERRFFINSYYGGCAGDIGWLIVDEGTGCIEWQGYDSSPVILYSRATTRQNWYTGNIGVARAMTIDVKLGN